MLYIGRIAIQNPLLGIMDYILQQKPNPLLFLYLQLNFLALKTR